ncbi:MAG: ABC transporter substrate-binding protein [Lysobacterales bacterium]
MTHKVRDQMGRAVEVPVTPQRVVSLVPSQTELLFDLGVEDRVAGVTRYCLHPKRARIACGDAGGTKKVKLESIKALKPDLIIGNKEENDKESIERLAKHYPVWMSDIESFDDAVVMMESIGGLMGVGERAAAMVGQIRDDWQALPDGNETSVAYLIWKKPYMACGSNTFIQAVLDKLNFNNVFADTPRYPETDLDQLAKRAPDWVFLSSEPFPFTQVHVDEVGKLLPNSRVIRVDGEMFSWYGSRLCLAPAYFQSLMAQMKEPAHS